MAVAFDKIVDQKLGAVDGRGTRLSGLFLPAVILSTSRQPIWLIIDILTPDPRPTTLKSSKDSGRLESKL